MNKNTYKHSTYLIRGFSFFIHNSMQRIRISALFPHILNRTKYLIFCAILFVVLLNPAPVAAVGPYPTETWSSGMNGWTAWDANSTNGQYYWGITSDLSRSSPYSMYVAENYFDIIPDDYTNYMDAHLQKVFNLNNSSWTSPAYLNFYYMINTEYSWDIFYVRASCGGSTWNDLFSNSGGSFSQWIWKSIDISSYVGCSQFYLDFYFHSDGSGIGNVSSSLGTGIYLDDISIDMTSNDITPPTPPGNLTRTDGGTAWTSDNIPSFSWTASTDVGMGVESYRWRVDANPTKTTYDGWTSGLSTTLGAQSDGTHTFNLIAVDYKGNVSSPVVSTTFKIDATAPNPPTGLTDGVTGWTNDNTPTFTWSSPGDTSGITGYYWSTTDSTPDSGDNWTTLTYVTLPSQSDGTHTFYVAAKNGTNLIGSPSSHVFQIDTTPPGAPSSLTDGITGWNKDNTPTFSWNAPSDTSGISGYYWSTTDSTPDSGDNWVSTPYVTLPSQSDGNHTFYVAAMNGANLIGSPASHTFQTDATVPTSPGAPDLYYGDDSGQSNSDNITNDSSIRFDWSGSNDATSGLSGYYWALDDSTPSSGGSLTSNSYITGLNPAEGGRTLYVQAVDNAGNLSGVQSLSFTIDRTAPPPPTFIDPGERLATTDTTPSLDWQDVSGAWKYQVLVREDVLIPLISYTSPELMTSQWTVSSTLAYKSWGWQVRAWDIAGNQGSYGRNSTSGDWGHFYVMKLTLATAMINGSTGPVTVAYGSNMNTSGTITGSGDGPITYHWEWRPVGGSIWQSSGLNQNVTLNNGTANITPYSAQPAGVGSWDYRIVVTSPSYLESNLVRVIAQQFEVLGSEAFINGTKNPVTVDYGQNINESGKLTGTLSGTVTYHWEWQSASGGAWQSSGINQTVTMTNGVANISAYSVQPVGPGVWNYRIVVTSPSQVVSNQVQVTVRQFEVLSAEAFINGTKNPVTVDYGQNINESGKLTGTLSGTVTYHWEWQPSSGGAWQSSGMNQTVSMTNGVANISAYSAQPAGPGVWNYRIVVTSPSQVMSNQVQVTVRQFEVLGAEAVINGTKNPVTVDYGQNINESGKLTGTLSGTVTYHWEWQPSSGGAWQSSGMNQTVTMTNGVANISAYSAQPAGPGVWNYRIVVTSPSQVESNQVQVTVRQFEVLGAEAVINGTKNPVTVDYGQNINESGKLTGTLNGTVTYHWEWQPSSGGAWQSSGMNQTVTMTNGVANISAYSAQPAGPGVWNYRIVVTSPSYVESNQVQVTVRNEGIILDELLHDFVGAVKTEMVITFQNTGQVNHDYRIEPKTIPAGWVVGNGSLLNNYVQVNGVPSGQQGQATFYITSPNLAQNTHIVFGLSYYDSVTGWRDASSKSISVSSSIDQTPPTITNVEVEQDNLGHLTVYATVTDAPLLEGVNPDKVWFYFDDIDDIWPMDYVRMDYPGGTQYSFTIPYGLIIKEFPDQHRLRMYIRAEDFAGNQTRFDISPDPFVGNAYLTVNNGSGKSTRLTVTDPGENVVGIEFFPATDLGGGQLSTEFRVQNNRFIWLEIVPTLTNQGGTTKIPMPGFFDFSSSLGYVSSLGNRNLADGGDLLSAKGIHVLQWPPVIPKDQYIDYTVTTLPDDFVNLKIYSKDDGTKWNVVLQTVAPLLRVLNIPLSLSDNSQLEKFEKGIVYVQTIMLIADESQSFWDELNKGHVGKAIVDLAFAVANHYKDDKLGPFLANRAEDAIRILVENDVITSPSWGSETAAKAQEIGGNLGSYLKLVEVGEEIINSGIAIYDYVRTPDIDHVEITHVTSYDVITYLQGTVPSDHGLPNSADQGAEVYRWTLGENENLDIHVANSGNQYLHNVWLAVELFSPPQAVPHVDGQGNLTSIEIVPGYKVESVRTPLQDPDLQDNGDFVLKAAAVGTNLIYNMGDVIIEPQGEVEFSIYPYALINNQHPSASHTYYAGTYSLRYAVFVDGYQGDQEGVPARQISDWKEVQVQIVDPSIPDAPGNLIGLANDGWVQLNWEHPPQWSGANFQTPTNRDIVGYEIFRSSDPAGLGNGTPYSFALASEVAFVDKDDNFVPDQEYFYALKSVDLKGSESNLSDPVSLVPIKANRTILGYVFDHDGNPIDGVTLQGFPDTVVTNPAGEYTAIVPYGWNGTVVPQKDGYSFIFLNSGEPFAEYSNTTTNLTGQNYLGELQNLAVSGHVKYPDNTPARNVLLTSTGGGSSVTDSSGFYKLYVPFQWSGTVTPSLEGHHFSLEFHTYANLTTDLSSEDFTVETDTFVIQGYVQTSGGQSLENVVMNGLPSPVQTDSSGFYQSVVEYDWSGIVTPVKDNYSFTPHQQVYHHITSNQTLDYTGYTCALLLQPSNPVPGNHNLNVSITQNLNWDDVPGAERYDLYFGTINPPQYFGTTSDSQFDLPNLTSGVTYYWRVVAINQCGESFPGSDWDFSTQRSNTAPTLGWTGETNYVSDGLNPESGTEATSFIFRIKYSDLNGDAPGFVRLHLLKGGAEVVGSPFVMNYASGDALSGAIYSHSISGLEPDSGYTYYFDAKDNLGLNATNTVTKSGPNLSILVIKPEIDIQRIVGVSIPNQGSDAVGNQPQGITNLTYVLDNSNGTGVLSITDVSAINLNNTDSFSIKPSLPINIAAGQTDSLEIQFNTEHSGDFSLDLLVVNNDLDENPYTLTVSGVAVKAIEWQPEIVDSGGESLVDTNLVLDSQGYPHIAYFDYTNYDLKYAFFDGTAWQIARVHESGDTGHDPWIAIGANGVSQFSWNYYGTKSVAYGIENGSGFSISTVHSGAWPKSISMALDSTDHPHLSYWTDGGDQLMHAWYDGTSWRLEVVKTTAHMGMFTSIAMDSQDRPRIAYSYSGNNTLNFAFYDGSWQFETIDNALYSYGPVSLALDSLDRAHIAHQDRDGNHLDYYWNDGYSWQHEQIGSAAYGNITIRIDSANQPHIGYLYNDGASNLVSYAYKMNNAWSFVTIAQGSAQWLALDENDVPGFSYVNQLGELCFSSKIGSGPIVSSIQRFNPNPTKAKSVDYTIFFSEPVFEVDEQDFELVVNGISNASIQNVLDSGDHRTYFVTVNTGIGNGILQLNLRDNDSIIDGNGLKLGGEGFGNGDFLGEIYTVSKTKTVIILSQATYDGWVLESSETSGKGGMKNNREKLLYVGDDSTNKQYRSILSFNTAGTPSNAVITKVTLRVKRSGVVGRGNPIKALRGFMVDVKTGNFGTPKLALGDFQSKPTKTYGPFKPALSGGWYNIDLTSGKDYLSRTGTTQMRLRFKLDDNNNSVANYLKLYSGNAGTAASPQLIVEYYVP